jgi:23S rRNA (adenine1618-N6)-methyltransferase
MHSRNRYVQPYDFSDLAGVVPALKAHFITTSAGRISLDFTNPDAVRLLNKALLLRDYDLKHWDIPAGNLCPGVPGRLDYVHVVADLMARPQDAKKGEGSKVSGLDVGTGASLVYPILAVREYGWRMVGSDVDEASLKVARAIVKFNPGLIKKVSLRRQPDPLAIFRGVIRPGERFDFTMCNPPFFASANEATTAAAQKWEKLRVDNDEASQLNFGGQANELWTAGGEPDFLRRMIRESADFGGQVGWFTTLVSKKGYLKIAEVEFARLGITDHNVVGIGQGGKIRRILCWQL